jgi:peroxiredoxin
VEKEARMTETNKNRRSAAERIEVVANISLIAAAVVFIAVISWLFWRHYSSLRRPHSAIQPGTRLTLPEVDWSASPQTLLLFLSTECEYCTASARFYQRLVNRAALTHNTQLIAIFPQTINESREYLARHGIQVDTLQKAVLASMGVRGTPTLILVDGNGVVINAWDGKVPLEVENEIVALVK